MAKNPDDDLFATSTMSIGDHLEELRMALFKSVVGLFVGVLIGLACANWVVDKIKAPLQASLENFYINKSINQLSLETNDLELKKTSDPVNIFIHKYRLYYEPQYVEAKELDRLQKLREEAAKLHAETKTPPPAAKPTSDKPQEPVRATPRILGLENREPPGEIMIVTRTWRPIQTVVKALNAQEVFMIWMKAGLVAGAIFSSPYIFLQIWYFVAAGLYPHERKYVHIYLPFSLILFLAGAWLCYTFVIPIVLEWLLGFNDKLKIDPDPRISEWMGFVLFLPLGFGISFQLPLVMLLLNRVGLLSVETYIAKWRISILVIFVISMVLTPADPVSMLFMALPLTALYFGGIGLCKWMPRGRNPFTEAYEP